MGKKKVMSCGHLGELVLSSADGVLGLATKLLGLDGVIVEFQCGREHLYRICGDEAACLDPRGDVFVFPWDFESGRRGDSVWRHARGQADDVRRRGWVANS